MDRDFLIDLFSAFGDVSIRRMFSGYGVSVDGVNFALALRGALYFRVDEQTVSPFEREGSAPFKYATRAKEVTVGSYWQLPERLYDEPEELAQWAHAALAAARRAAAGKRAKAGRPKAGEVKVNTSGGNDPKGGKPSASRTKTSPSKAATPAAKTARKKAATKRSAR
jgi:DNA transformation protein